MKQLFLLALCLYSALFFAQTYPSSNISLAGMIHPNTASGVEGFDGRRYNGCWGWKQASQNREYAIIGASHGVYFVEITNPSTPSVCAFVPGRQNCTWREIKTYQNYCYVVSDDSSPNRFQIIDMSALPATVTVVHDGTSYFERGHTIYIDGDKMYIGSTTYTAGGDPYSSMNVYSLATPTNPTLLRRLDQDYPFVTTVHDMFVVNDTVYASCGYQGLQVFVYKSSLQTFTQVGSYTNYNGAPYNHSSWITANRKHLVFCDEVPVSLPIRLVNVENLSNIQPVSTFQPHTNTTAHNPYVLGNNFAVIASYQDGLNIYNISNPANPFLCGFFDTHPQGGAHTGDYFGQHYRGNWGAYPYLPSGIIIATDMQNGAFFLDASSAFAQITGIEQKKNYEARVNFFPNPAKDKISLHYNKEGKALVEISNTLGQIVFEKEYSDGISDYIMVNDLPNGTYVLSVKSNGNSSSKKLIVNH